MKSLMLVLLNVEQVVLGRQQHASETAQEDFPTKNCSCVVCCETVKREGRLTSR